MWAGQSKVRGSLARIKCSLNSRGPKSGYHPEIELNFETVASGSLAYVQTSFFFPAQRRKVIFSLPPPPGPEIGFVSQRHCFLWVYPIFIDVRCNVVWEHSASFGAFCDLSPSQSPFLKAAIAAPPSEAGDAQTLLGRSCTHCLTEQNTAEGGRGGGRPSQCTKREY